MTRPKLRNSAAWGLVLLSFFVSTAFTAVASEEKDQTSRSQDEKRSSIHCVDGYANLSENQTLAETRRLAFINAKRDALEMARTYINARTKVEDFALKYDVIWSTAEGSVTVLEQKDLGIENNSRYHVWIKAEVTYEVKPKIPDQGGTADKAPCMPSAGPLSVQVWTDKKIYKKGEPVKVFMQGNRDFYARVMDVSSDGDIVQLLPNAYRADAHFQAGKVYLIPDGPDRFSMEAAPPFGEDKVVVYASESPIGDASMEPTADGRSLYRGSLECLNRQSRGVAVNPQVRGAVAGAEFIQAICTLNTVEK
jgi:hypothetical protein